jgi:prolyl oligopeptidase
MTKKVITLLLLFVLFFPILIHSQTLDYPDTKKVDTVDTYFGTEVPDPYRWLEDDNSKETEEWVKAQNELTQSYLSKISFRDDIQKRLTEIWDYEKYSAPSKKGEYYFFSKNEGLQEQSVIYYQKGLDGEPEVFLDPNKFSDDGSVSLKGMYFSKDHQYCGYGISRGGSDWTEFYVMNVDDKNKLDDHIKWVKFSGMSWYKDGFFYSRYDKPEEGEKLKAKNEYQKLYYHKLGTPQSEDKLVHQNTDKPKRGFGAQVTDDQKYLIINIWEGSATYNLLSYKNLEEDSEIKPIITEPEARYWVIDNIGDKFLVQTDYKAPNMKVVMMDPENPSKENWEEIIPESENSLKGVSYVGGRLIASYLEDATTRVKVFDTDGNHLHDVDLPGIGSASGFGGEKDQNEVFYSFSSFTQPTTIYKYNIKENKSELFRKSQVKFEPENFTTKQVFYKSKDGTEIPMFIVHKKGLELDGTNPTLLYAYGGFNISMTPSFRLSIIPLLENGAVYAMACLRGGGEYGEKWHKAGMLENKQNVFDDFIAAAEYLIEENYTNSDKLAIQGGSNGGLLVGAVTNQRPELFEVAIPQVGVMDMLRFHKFTIGWAWVSEYGSSEDSTQFEYLYDYSPLHNIKSGVDYPAVLATTADHDDRVFPAHTFKYMATLQEKDTGDEPTLVRIETKVGHGAGTSTSKTIDLYADLWSFMLYNMDEKPKF